LNEADDFDESNKVGEQENQEELKYGISSLIRASLEPSLVRDE
jgi:hypothetical protein